MKKRRYVHLSIPAIRKYRKAVEHGGIADFIMDQGEKFGAGSVVVRYTLKNRPWIVTLEAKRNANKTGT